MENETKESIPNEQRNRLITILEDVEQQIIKQNSLKRTFFKGVLYGIGTVIGASVLVALFGGIIATTINTVTGEDTISKELLPTER